MEDLQERWLDTCFGLRPGYFFAFPKPQELQIRNNHLGASVVRIAGKEQDDWIAAAFGRVDGRTKVRDILQEIPAEKREFFLRILFSLRRGYLIETDGATVSLDPQKLFLTRGPAAFYDEAIGASKVLLIGAGVLGSRVAMNLAQYGWRELTILDRQTVAKKDQQTSPAYVHAQEGKPRATELREFLVKMTGQERIVGMAVDQYDQELFDQMLAENTLAVLVEDVFEPGMQRALNQSALKTGTPWTMAMIDGFEAYLGPTFLPHQTGCYECLHQHHVGHLENAESFLYYEQYLTEKEIGAELLIAPMIADFAAGLLASDLPNVVERMPERIETDASLTLGRQLRMNFKTYDASFRPLVKMPRCKICGQVK